MVIRLMFVNFKYKKQQIRDLLQFEDLKLFMDKTSSKRSPWFILLSSDISVYIDLAHQKCR